MNLSSRLRRRHFLSGLGIGAAGLALGCQPGQSSTSAALTGPKVLPTASTSPVAGTLLVVQNGNLFRFSLATRQPQPLSHFPKGAYAASPTLSPDRRTLAYTYYLVPTDQQALGGSDLYVMDTGGTNPREIAPHGAPGATFEDPAWGGDGKSLYATHRRPIYDQKNQYQGETLEIVRIWLDGSTPATVLKDAMDPAPSPDGEHLVYALAGGQGQPKELWIANAEGKAGKPLVDQNTFTYIGSPRFAPDGSWLAFAAVGGPSPAKADARSGLVPPWAPAVAEAHGIPWEIWLVRPDGSELRRLTDLAEDTPVLTWSPDGGWIAFAGEIGLYLVDTAGQQTIRLSEFVSGGGIAWLG